MAVSNLRLPVDSCLLTFYSVKVKEAILIVGRFYHLHFDSQSRLPGSFSFAQYIYLRHYDKKFYTNDSKFIVFFLFFFFS